MFGLGSTPDAEGAQAPVASGAWLRVPPGSRSWLSVASSSEPPSAGAAAAPQAPPALSPEVVRAERIRRWREFAGIPANSGSSVDSRSSGGENSGEVTTDAALQFWPHPGDGSDIAAPDDVEAEAASAHMTSLELLPCPSRPVVLGDRLNIVVAVLAFPGPPEEVGPTDVLLQRVSARSPASNDCNSAPSATAPVDQLWKIPEAELQPGQTLEAACHQALVTFPGCIGNNGWRKRLRIQGLLSLENYPSLRTGLWMRLAVVGYLGDDDGSGDDTAQRQSPEASKADNSGFGWQSLASLLRQEVLLESGDQLPMLSELAQFLATSVEDSQTVVDAKEEESADDEKESSTGFGRSVIPARSSAAVSQFHSPRFSSGSIAKELRSSSDDSGGRSERVSLVPLHDDVSSAAVTVATGSASVAPRPQLPQGWQDRVLVQLVLTHRGRLLMQRLSAPGQLPSTVPEWLPDSLACSQQQPPQEQQQQGLLESPDDHGNEPEAAEEGLTDDDMPALESGDEDDMDDADPRIGEGQAGLDKEKQSQPAQCTSAVSAVAGQATVDVEQAQEDIPEGVWSLPMTHLGPGETLGQAARRLSRALLGLVVGLADCKVAWVLHHPKKHQGREGFTSGTTVGLLVDCPPGPLKSDLSFVGWRRLLRLQQEYAGSTGAAQLPHLNRWLDLAQLVPRGTPAPDEAVDAHPQQQKVMDVRDAPAALLPLIRGMLSPELWVGGARLLEISR